MVQVHPVVSRLCAPIEGTDAAHLADCLGLDPAKFRQQVNAASSDAREEAQLAAASVFDDDDRYKVAPHKTALSDGCTVYLWLCQLLLCAAVAAAVAAGRITLVTATSPSCRDCCFVSLDNQHGYG